eukprot:Tbor_TRINITY_DN4514_c0_g1::TRINITY_DN4514_c0_g1_i1::g.15773::m.15773/K05857/PLCD; phosphatidylinositol phospholipase C, delta
MADIMREVLGDTLAVPFWGPCEPPTYPCTPHELTNKILIKAKRVAGGFEEPFDDFDDDDVPEEGESVNKNMMKNDKKAKNKLDKTKHKKEKYDSPEDSYSQAEVILKPKESGKRMSQKLSDLVIVEAVPYTEDTTVLDKRQGYNCSSFTEGKASQIMKNQREMFRTLNSCMLSRIYPSGRRFDSSNFHPLPYWNDGCQIVSLNWQTSDSYEMRLNKGRFMENGNCGYILKPKYLRDLYVGKDNNTEKEASSVQMQAREKQPYSSITVGVISGFHLPKPEGKSDKTEVVDPYVCVYIEGPGLPLMGKKSQAMTHDVCDAQDTIATANNNTQIKGKALPVVGTPKGDGCSTAKKEYTTLLTTNAIHDNGFHPVWRKNGDNNSIILNREVYRKNRNQNKQEANTDDDCTISKPRQNTNTIGCFKVPVWSMSCLVMQVWDKDVDSDDFLGEIIIPLRILKEGVRCFPLNNIHSKPIPGAILMCEISFEN